MKKINLNDKEINNFRNKIPSCCQDCIINILYSHLRLLETEQEIDDISDRICKTIEVNGCALSCLEIFTNLDDKFVPNNYKKIYSYLEQYNDSICSASHHLSCISSLERRGILKDEGSCINFFYFLYDKIYISKKSNDTSLDIE
jgi:hypothetical protein